MGSCCGGQEDGSPYRAVRLYTNQRERNTMGLSKMQEKQPLASLKHPLLSSTASLLPLLLSSSSIASLLLTFRPTCTLPSTPPSRDKLTIRFSSSLPSSSPSRDRLPRRFSSLSWFCPGPGLGLLHSTTECFCSVPCWASSVI